MLFRDLEQKIIKVINESGMSIDAIYFVMKSLMAEVELKYNEYCRIEDAEAIQRALESKQSNEDSSSKEDKLAAAQ